MKALTVIKVFLKHYGRYIGAAALFAVLVIVIVKFVKPSGKAASSPNAPEVRVSSDAAGDTEIYSVDADQKINDLINQYYTYYANGDIANLEKIARPLSDSEKSFIQMYSSYVEKYENLACYTKNGLTDGSHMVSVYLEIKFNNAETLAPGLDFFYVETDADGNYFINNLYSQYNSLTNEQATDPAIDALIDSFEAQEDVVALQVDVQNQYEAAVNSDATLSQLVNTEIKDAYSAWAQSMNQSEAPAEEAAAETPAETPQVILLKTTDRVNVRDAASTDGNPLETVDAGTEVTLVSDAGNGWYQITHGAITGFIRSDFLAAVDPAAAAAPADPAAAAPDADPAAATDAAAAEPTAPAETTQEAAPAASENTVTLQQHDNVIIRSGASSDSDQLGTVYSGETVKVLGEENGWNKVEWNGITGYIRSDLLS